MSVLTLNASGSVSPPIPRDHQRNAEQSPPQSGFGAVMKSVSGRDGRSRDLENVNKSDKPTTLDPTQATHTPANTTLSDGQATGSLGPVFGSPASALPLSADLDWSSSSEQLMSGASELTPFSNLDKGPVVRRFTLSANNAPGGSDTLVSKGVSNHGDSVAEPRASSLARGVVGLRVVHAASHLGTSTLLHVSNRDSSSQEGVSQEAHAQSAAASGASSSFPENEPLASNDAEKSQILDTTIRGGLTPILSSNNDALKSLVDTVAEAASSLNQTDQVSKSDGSAVVSLPSNATGDGMRELDVRLDLLDSGPMSVKLKLFGSDLSVVIEVSNQDMLSAIERERDTIINRINSSDHQVSSLVLRSADASASLSEDGETYRRVAGNESNAQQQSDQHSPWRGSGTGKHRPGADSPNPSFKSGGLLI